eukprot:5164657-Amphidinium_carterae.1
MSKDAKSNTHAAAEVSAHVVTATAAHYCSVYPQQFQLKLRHSQAQTLADSSSLSTMTTIEVYLSVEEEVE